MRPSSVRSRSMTLRSFGRRIENRTSEYARSTGGNARPILAIAPRPELSGASKPLRGGYGARAGDLAMVRPVRFERTTHGFEGHCSIQLSYGRKCAAPAYHVMDTRTSA